MSSFVLRLDCPDQPGIVHAVSAYLHQAGGNIVDSRQFAEPGTGRFLMRVQADAPGVTLEGLRDGFGPLAEQYAMTWRFDDLAVKPRILIMVSKYQHCLADLLYRVQSGDLPAEIAGVVSNHPDLAGLAAFHGVHFHHVPVTAATKPEAEARLLALVDELRVDLVVLARYMQILSDGLCAKLDGRAINIHHSFLPSFKGGKPYHQAYDRGVKLVGATAHYVTADLDEGPIIEQEVARVDHSHHPDELVAIGRDLERLTLARAVRWHSEHRILLNAGRTVVFR
ncbi:formyltetrahydrofolate deformylase [Longispora albida]|uniref:formyltetrahydrofolate deformylase n=1 Tax=Longispora albida TaxID=203523 RepID=UPI00036CF5F9|nr:formyltetrahydrofolate deformylase [Longispora albida]